MLPYISSGTLINKPMVRIKMLPWATAASATTLSTLMTKSAAMMVPTADHRPGAFLGARLPDFDSCLFLDGQFDCDHE